MVVVEISGLARYGRDLSKDDERHTICIDLPWDTEIPHIFSDCFSEFIKPDEIVRPTSYDHSHCSFRSESMVSDEHPGQKLRIVTDKPSDFVAGEINMDDSFLHFINLEDDEPMKADLSVPTLRGGSEELVIDDLRIKFHRTIRIPDDNRLHQLPMSLGAFSLYNVGAFSERLPEHIAETGGVFFPMWQREAMWIQFESSVRSFAVRVNVGRVNAISGLTLNEKVDKQDYIVIPGQRWLDGIAIEPGVVRQFVAMPLGSGYTVEGQVTSEEKFGGFQIEVTPAYQKLGTKTFWYEDRTGKCINIEEAHTPRNHGLKEGNVVFMTPMPRKFYRAPRLREFLGPEEAPEGIARLNLKAEYLRRSNCIINSVSMVGITEIENPRFPQSPTNFFVQPLTSSIDQSHITYCAKPMGQAVSISYIERQSDELAEEFDVEMDLGLDDALEASNGVIKTAPQLEVMGIAAGGKLIQDLVADFRPPHMWNTSRTCLTNIHIFSPASFEAVTHIVPYDVPITAKDYADAGQPFFIVEEDTENRIDGSETLDAVKSVSEMDKQIGVDTTGASSADTKVPKQCGVCKVRLCDCIVRPCNHQFCFSCVKQVEAQAGQKWKCPAISCGAEVVRVAGFSAPMNLPGEEAFRVDVPVVLLKVEDGRMRFSSVSKTRI